MMQDAERDAADVTALEERRNAALVACDIAVLDSIYADAAVIYHGSGAVDSKAALLGNLPARLEIREASTRDVACRASHGLVVMTGQHEMVVRQKLKPGTDFYPAKALMTLVWERIDGRWRLVHQHQTRLPPDLSPK